MSDTPSNTVFVIAAISVILFSVVGVGVMTGLIPSAISKPDNPKVVVKNARTAAASGIPPAQPACADCGRIEMVPLVEPPAAPSAAGASPDIAHHPKPILPQRYEVLVRLADGTARTFSYETRPEFRVGDPVTIHGATLSTH